MAFPLEERLQHRAASKRIIQMKLIEPAHHTRSEAETGRDL
jgi:hypothetical protein